MQIGISRREQWGLLGAMLLFVGGIWLGRVLNEGSGDEVYVEGQGTWRKLSELDAGADQPHGLIPEAEGAAGSSPVLSQAAAALPEASGSAPARSTGLNINTAGPSEFEALPGIGPSKAAAIVTTRERLGRFASVDQLLEVPGIGEKTLDQLRPLVMVVEAAQSTGEVAAPQPSSGAVLPPAAGAEIPVAPAAALPVAGQPAQQTAAPVAGSAGPDQSAGQPSVGLLNINTASQLELESLPGIGPVLAQRIITHRQRYGSFRRLEDLMAVEGLGPKRVGDLRGHVVF